MSSANRAAEFPEMSIPWWTRVSRWNQTSLREAAHAEQGLLSLIPGHTLMSYNVPVGPGKQDWLHTITNTPLPPSASVPATPACKAGINSPSTSASTNDADTSTGASPSVCANGSPVVMMPGYGAGAGFYFRNLTDIGNSVRLFAVDWLGTGLSGRPRYTAKTRTEAEDFFINSLAAWKQKAGLGDERMILVGHSLGGYLAAAYALARPQDVQHLVLVCPAGVPKAPEDWQDKFLGSRAGWSGTMFRAAMKAWEAGLTPHSLVRALGPWGERLCHNYVARRFLHHGDGLDDKEAFWFKRYFYHIIAQPGSGEYALRHLLAPGAWAHEPLATRLRELQVPVTFIYGAHDWMRPQHAVDLVRQFKKERPAKVGSDLHVEIIDDAGHFVFIDQPHLFNKALLDACKTAALIPVGPEWGENFMKVLVSLHTTEPCPIEDARVRFAHSISRRNSCGPVHRYLPASVAADVGQPAVQRSDSTTWAPEGKPAGNPESNTTATSTY